MYTYNVLFKNNKVKHYFFCKDFKQKIMDKDSIENYVLIQVILWKMAKNEPFALSPCNALLSTQEAANFLNVSRPFLVKQLEQKKIDHIKVGRHRRIEFGKLLEYKNSMQQHSEQALQDLADQAKKLQMGY